MEGSSLLHQRADAVGLSNELIAVSGGGHIDIYLESQFESSRVEFFNKADIFLGNLVCPSLISSNSLIPFASTVEIYPNPAKDVLTISFDQELSGVDISIYNLNGQLINHRSNIFGDQITLNLTEINSGFYLLELVDQNGGVEVRKVLVR